jgi:hypothetical protein
VPFVCMSGGRMSDDPYVGKRFLSVVPTLSMSAGVVNAGCCVWDRCVVVTG